MTSGNTIYGGYTIDPLTRDLLESSAKAKGTDMKGFLKMLLSDIESNDKTESVLGATFKSVEEIEKSFDDGEYKSPEKDNTFKKVKGKLKKFDGDAVKNIVKSEINDVENIKYMGGLLDEKPRPNTPSEEYMKNVKAVNHVAQSKSKVELMNDIKKESDNEFDMAKKEAENLFKENIEKRQRKLCSYTLDNGVIQMIDVLSKQLSMNKSRFIEHLVKEYKAESISTQKNALRVANSAGPIDLPIDKISEKVFEHLVSNGYVKAS